MPACFVGPCLSRVHGAMSRIDDLVAGLAAFLKSTCVTGEEVEVAMPNGSREFVNVRGPASGMPPFLWPGSLLSTLVRPCLPKDRGRFHVPRTSWLASPPSSCQPAPLGRTWSSQFPTAPVSSRMSSAPAQGMLQRSHSSDARSWSHSTGTVCFRSHSALHEVCVILGRDFIVLLRLCPTAQHFLFIRIICRR